jgi:hypothetical protein
VRRGGGEATWKEVGRESRKEVGGEGGESDRVQRVMAGGDGWGSGKRGGKWGGGTYSSL